MSFSSAKSRFSVAKSNSNNVYERKLAEGLYELAQVSSPLVMYHVL